MTVDFFMLALRIFLHLFPERIYNKLLNNTFYFIKVAQIPRRYKCFKKIISKEDPVE